MSKLYDYYAKNNVDVITEYDITRKFLATVDPYVGGIPVCFVTTPNLNLDGNKGLSEFLSETKRVIPSIYKSLTDGGHGSFIPLATNYFKGLNGKDLAARTIDIGETMYGWKQTVPGPQVDSVIGDTVSLKFYETKYLPIIKTFKIWMDYIENVGSGFFVPNSACVNKNEYDYMCSIYYFVLDQDLETILYYCKYTGAAPVSNPYGELVSSIGDSRDIKEIEIEFSYNLKEDLDPVILSDFNKRSSDAINKELNSKGETPDSNLLIPLYDDSGFNNFDKETREEIFSKYLNNPKTKPIVVRTSEKSIDGITPRVKYKLVLKEVVENNG